MALNKYALLHCHGSGFWLCVPVSQWFTWGLWSCLCSSYSVFYSLYSLCCLLAEVLVCHLSYRFLLSFLTVFPVLLCCVSCVSFLCLPVKSVSYPCLFLYLFPQLSIYPVCLLHSLAMFLALSPAPSSPVSLCLCLPYLFPCYSVFQPLSPQSAVCFHVW